MLDKYPFISFKDSAFAQFTFAERYPKILNTIIEDSLFDQKTNRLLSSCLENFVAIKLPHEHPELWQNFYKQYGNKNLDELPFLAAETYFFALLRHITKYNSNKVDPFKLIKKRDVENNLKTISRILRSSKKWKTLDFLKFALEGNKSDLSQLKHGQSIKIDYLLDHSEKLISTLENKTEIHIILDNSGLELFSDMLLAIHLAETYDLKIIMHIKPEPTFVSDTIIDDIEYLSVMISDASFQEKWNQFTQSGHIEIKANPFWTSPIFFTDLNNHFKFSEDSMIISKGDANYRKFFEDRYIPHEVKSKELTSYLTVPTFALRTLKSEVQTDISKEEQIKLNEHSKNWLTNGEFAVIQHLNPE